MHKIDVYAQCYVALSTELTLRLWIIVFKAHINTDLGELR